MSTMDANDQPMIVVSAMTMAESAAYGRFLMAHECSHHTLGHVAAYHRELGHLGPQPFFYIAPQLKHMELDADCNAVQDAEAQKRARDHRGRAADDAANSAASQPAPIIRPASSGPITSPNAPPRY